MEEWHSEHGIFKYDSATLLQVAKRFNVISSHVILKAIEGKPANGYIITKQDMETGARKELAEIKRTNREMDAWSSRGSGEEIGVSGPCVPCQASCAIS